MAYPHDSGDFFELESESTTGNTEGPPLILSKCYPSDSSPEPALISLKDDIYDPMLLDTETVVNIDQSLEQEVRMERVFDVQVSDFSPAIPYESIEKPAPLKRRGIKRGNNPLPTFASKSSKPPKHEYYLAMIIRALKKGVRVANSSGNTIPSSGVFKHLSKNPKAERKWAVFGDYVVQHPELKPAAKTEAGPNTDGKSKRSAEADSEFPSFNKKYIQHHFSSRAVRTAHYYITEVMFEGSCEQRCERMRFRCHQGGMHTEECEMKWKDLKTYTQDGMVREVGWEPFIPN